MAKAITGRSTDRMREHYSTVSADNVRAAGDQTAALFQGKLRLIQGGAGDGSLQEETTGLQDAKTAGEGVLVTGSYH